jgi:hypothetical protein
MLDHSRKSLVRLVLVIKVRRGLATLVHVNVHIHVNVYVYAVSGLAKIDKIRPS